METTNLYNFLHFLSLIKIRPNMDFGGGFGICTYMPQYFFFSLFYSKREWSFGSQAKTKLKGKRYIMASIHLFVHLGFSN